MMGLAVSEEEPLIGTMETVAKATVSMVPIVGGPAVVVWDAVRDRLAAKMQKTADEIIADVGVDLLAARLAESSEFEALTVNAMEAAARTGYESRRRLLGRVVINVATDDARIEHSQLVCLAVRDLDAPHVRALERIREAHDSTEVTPLARGAIEQTQSSPNAQRARTKGKRGSRSVRDGVDRAGNSDDAAYEKGDMK